MGNGEWAKYEQTAFIDLHSPFNIVYLNPLKYGEVHLLLYQSSKSCQFQGLPGGWHFNEENTKALR
jgi:hypothetical protein